MRFVIYLRKHVHKIFHGPFGDIQAILADPEFRKRKIRDNLYACSFISCLLCIIALMQFRDGMLEDRKEKTKNLVEVSMGVLEYHQKLAQSGKLSDDEAKQAAKESLRNVRFGANDYYFILDTNHVYVLLPPRVEFEGQNKGDMKDANGKRLIQELVKCV